MTQIPTYPKIKSPGSFKGKSLLYEGEVVIQSKIDGSNVSFWKNDQGEVIFRSRNVMLDHKHPENNDKRFQTLIAEISSLKDKLDTRYIYRGEFLFQKRHNLLAYDRVPEYNFVLFDIQDCKTNLFLGIDLVLEEGKRIGFEVVPVLFRGELDEVKSKELFENILKEKTKFKSIAGSSTDFLGDAFEGIVIKNYGHTEDENYPIFAKRVCDEFRETANTGSSFVWKKGPGITSQIASVFCTPMRYQKAYQHLLERGHNFQNSPSDIPVLAQEVHRDIEEEEKENIIEALWESEMNLYPKKKRQDPEFIDLVKQELWEKHHNAILKKSTNNIGTWYKENILSKTSL